MSALNMNQSAIDMAICKITISDNLANVGASLRSDKRSGSMSPLQTILALYLMGIQGNAAFLFL
jgi:hypothetical protein